MLHNINCSKTSVLIHADKKAPVAITAKVGTLKRKQQMRDFLDHLPKDNHDDIFTATPFQNRRVKVNLGKQCISAHAFLLSMSRVCYKSAGSVPSIKPCGSRGRCLFSLIWTAGSEHAWNVASADEDCH